MSVRAPRKRRVDEVGVLTEPVFSPEQATEFARGIALFNAGKHWHAHEAWETAWLTMTDAPEDDAEIILRGLIQLAAALHLLGIGRLDGAESNFRKSRSKLALAGPVFLGINIANLLVFIDGQIQQLDPTLACRIEPDVDSVIGGE